MPRSLSEKSRRIDFSERGLGTRLENLLPDSEVVSNALCSVVRSLQEAVDEKNLSHIKGQPAICIYF